MMHLKAQHLEKLFPNSISLVERCHKVALEARGAGYLDRDLTAVGVQRANESTTMGDNQVDYIKQENGRRMFWVMVVGVR